MFSQGKFASIFGRTGRHIELKLLPINFLLFDLFTNPSFSQNTMHIYMVIGGKNKKINIETKNGKLSKKKERETESRVQLGENRITTMCSLFIMKTQCKSYHRFGKTYTIRNITAAACTQCIHTYSVTLSCAIFFTSISLRATVRLLLHSFHYILYVAGNLVLLHDCKHCNCNLIFYLRKTEFCICFL